MPHFDKWLTNVPADAPVSRVARRAIGSRLQGVAHYLAQAGQSKMISQGDVHQLRIWTRRAAAALRLFDALVPAKRSRRIRKTLRKLRRAAGSVRDCDVFLDRLEAGGESKNLVRALKSQRRSARRKLRTKCKRLLRHSRFERDCERLVQAVDWPKRHSSRKSPPFAEWCRAQLAKPAQQFGALAEAPLSTDQDWHALRIAGKRWRYALELATVALRANTHQRLYAALSELQDRLGVICDRLAAIGRLSTWQQQAESKQERRALRAAVEQETRKLAAAKRQFLRWWTISRRRRIAVLGAAAVADRHSRN